MFNRISGTYDFLNHLLSFGLDVVWRKRLISFIPKEDPLKLLDLATGTGDVLFTLVKNCPNITQAYGLDLAENMLKVAHAKSDAEKLNAQINFRVGNAANIPFPNQSFDVVTLAFGIRNMENVDKVLAEIHRTLTEQGRALILEFSLPKNPVLRSLHLFYLRVIVPIVGAVVSRDASAYRYLNQTIEQFPYGEKFCAIIKKNGFREVKFHPLTGGIATIYEMKK